jgi:LysR family transcriptional regulator, carnitine catabolism transcriptional activator
VAVVTAQRDAILPLVLAGAGAALVPEPIAAVARALGAPVARPVPVVKRSLALIHRNGPLAPAAVRFVDLATGGREYGAGMDGEGDRHRTREVP